VKYVQFLTELKGLLCIANFYIIEEEENTIPLVYTYVIVSSFVSLFDLYFILFYFSMSCYPLSGSVFALS
jgi:hypothetical protein